MKEVYRSTTKKSISSVPIARDLKTEIRKLEGQIAIQRDELHDLEEAHRARPYRRKFIVTIRKGYRSSLRELHSEIRSVRAMLAEKGDRTELTQ
jgi:hypothetical protein